MSQTELSTHRGSQAQQAVEMLQMEAGSAPEAATSACNNCRSFLFTGASWNLCLHPQPLCWTLHYLRSPQRCQSVTNQLWSKCSCSSVPFIVTQFHMSNPTHKPMYCDVEVWGCGQVIPHHGEQDQCPCKQLKRPGFFHLGCEGPGQRYRL